MTGIANSLCFQSVVHTYRPGGMPIYSTSVQHICADGNTARIHSSASESELQFTLATNHLTLRPNRLSTLHPIFRPRYHYVYVRIALYAVCIRVNQIISMHTMYKYIMVHVVQYACSSTHNMRIECPHPTPECWNIIPSLPESMHARPSFVTVFGTYRKENFSIYRMERIHHTGSASPIIC